MLDRILQSCAMLPCAPGFYRSISENDCRVVLVAEDPQGAIVGVVTGVDHFRAFADPDNGSSLWALAVDRQCPLPGVGETLVRELILRFMEQGRSFLDLSVLHTNKEAIALYDKLGFEQVPVYVIKKKNPINEPLFVGPEPEEGLNIYARIITNEARRRGIGVEVRDAEHGLFDLCTGGRRIACRESLSELTSAVAMSCCDDKAVTREAPPSGRPACPPRRWPGAEQVAAFLERCSRVVVKPARGEQGGSTCRRPGQPGRGAGGGGTGGPALRQGAARNSCRAEDVRLIVIDYTLVAAAVRRPATVLGNGELTVRELIEKQSRRRAAATAVEEHTIPVDAETTVRTVGRKARPGRPAEGRPGAAGAQDR